MKNNCSDGEAPYLEDLELLRKRYFLAPDGSNKDYLLSLLREAVDIAVNHQGQGPTFKRTTASPNKEDVVRDAQIPNELSADPFAVVASLAREMEGSVKASHPYMLKNVIPLPAWTYFAGNTVASIYMPNGVTGEDAANSVNAELKVAKVYSELAGYDPAQSGGLFTFGGTGTNLYAFKMGISKADPDFFFNGNQNNLVIVGSKPAHYAQQNATNWLGLGRRNYLMARSNMDQTTDIEDMERICAEQIRAGKRIACIVGVGGTTANMAIDNFAELAEMRDGLVKKFDLNYMPHVHSDSVIGWAYLHFSDYDFRNNPLGLSKKILEKLQRTVGLVSSFKFADSFGLDFHKTGYVPYVSSMIIAKNKQDLADLGRDSQMMTPLFFDQEAYNPGKYSLETSRSAANMVGTWLTVKALGKQGYQVLLGHAQEMAQFIRDFVNERSEETGMYVVNQDSFGSDVYVRCFPEGTSPAKAHKREIDDAAAIAETNLYNSNFYDWLQNSWAGGERGFAVGKTSASFYSPSGDGVTALRIYVLNPFISKETGVELIERISSAKKAFDEEAKMEPQRSAAANKLKAASPNCWS